MLAVSIIIAATGVAVAQPAPSTLERVRQAGVLHCGSAIRPGLAFPGTDQAWYGLSVGLCRAIAAAVLGPDAKTEFNGYALGKDFDRAQGADDVAFLTGSELFANGLFGALQPGPAVFYETSNVMVWQESPAQHVADLAGTMVCAEPGTGPERALLAYTQGHAIAIRYSGWQELEEMMDAFNVGRCPAVAGELTALAALRLGSELQGRPARILPEPLSVSPVLAMTPRGDAVWSALVSWTVQTVLAAEHPDGAASLPIEAPALGLQPGWQARALAAGGSYAELFRRNLGPDSPLDLPHGVNAGWQDGGLMAPPAVH